MINENRKRILLFVFACLLVRMGLAAVATYVEQEYKEYEYIMGIIYMVFAAAFFVRFLIYKSGDLGAFKGKVWWNNLRFIHCLFYTIYAILVFCKVPYAWVNLWVSVIVGIVAFTNHYANK